MGHRSRSARVLQGRLLLNRERELSQLGRALDGALRGRGQIVLIAGEAGIGKTTLAQVFAAKANTRGARVLWGRSGDLEGSPPYWPWAEALRALAEDGATDPQALFAPEARYLSLVLPELRARFPFDRSSVPDDESVRFHVAHAVRAVLQRAARQRSILLVLEDMHWADRGSLFLLEFMAQEIAETSLVVLATYRDGEVAAPLAQMLGELARLGAPRLILNGLTLDGTARLLARLTGRRVSTRLVRQIHARTGGNPFFVTEMARVDRRAPLAIPDNVRVAISRRLSHLSALANRTLVVAAVVGREFDFPVLRAALPEAAEEALLHVIDDALQAQVIEPHPSRGEEWYQFRHALIRDALYESISPSRRARWHATIAQALETHLGDHVEDRAAELARNAAAAGALIEPSILAKYSCIAGERLLAAHAFEEALSHFERAWRAREGLPFDASAAAMLVGLGRAQAATAVRWNRQQGWVTLRRALDYYLKAGEISQAIAVATDPHISVEGATGVAASIRQLHDLAPRGSLEEGRLLARMGAAEYFETGDYSAAQVAFARALDIAAAQRDAGLELRTLAYTALQAMFDPIVPKGTCGYVKSDYFDDIPRAMVDDLVAWAERKPYAMSMARLNHFGGAMSRIADDATPFPHRQALFAFSPDALWNRPEEADASVRWAKGYWQALRAYAPRGAYVNFMQEEGEDRVRESYQGNYDRLVQIKRRYDPRNLFRLNQNIKP